MHARQESQWETFLAGKDVSQPAVVGASQLIALGR